MSSNTITVTVDVNDKVKSALCTHFNIDQNALEALDGALSEELTNHLLQEIIHLTEVPAYQERVSTLLVDAPIDNELDELE